MSLHINNLPDGILRDILDYLPLDDRKSASLVCRLWDQEVFSTRLLTTVRLRVSCIMMNHKEKSLEVLQNSCRSYRNLLISLCGSGACSDIQFAFIVDVLDKFGSTVEGFTMIRGCSSVQLRDFVTRMPNLKHLTTYVTEADNRSTERLEFPVLTKLFDFDVEINSDDVFKRGQFAVQQMAPNVELLSLTFDKCDDPEWVFKVLKGYAGQLRSVDIFTPHNRIPIDELQFRRLQVLKLRGRAYSYGDAKLRKLFHGLPLLREAYLDFVISRSMLEIICKNCPQLMTLDIRTESLEERSFQCFEELTNLQVIIVNYLRLNLMEDCRPVMSVQKFHLHTDETYLTDESYIEQFHKVFPNLQSIKVYFRGFRTKIIDQLLVRQICRKFIHLKKLTLSGEFCLSATIKGFELPGDLGNVKELTLIRANLCISPLSKNSVKRLKLESLDPISFNVFRIEEVFPKLRYLEIRSCRQITPDVITDIRRSVPDCVVHYVHMERKWVYY
ncbi:uncharacterized protein LOC135709604 [Ochlerotatus camptorhynchus]|uniref:uncharacterized protein LOC135709604 n=1 Tax=Ochlerotatus camptorhynchus TaxID=644619 RepID=UPI0031D80568